MGLDPGHTETNWSKFRSDKAHPEGGTIGWSRITGILELGSGLCSLPPELCTSALGQSTEAHSLHCSISLPVMAGSLCCYCLSLHYTESSQQSFLCWTNSSSCFLKSQDNSVHSSGFQMNQLGTEDGLMNVLLKKVKKKKRQD